jgi:5-methylthioadenosine/S-adenosylhomocysteine deaminase
MHTLIGHGVHLSHEDVSVLATHGSAIAHCPGSNLKLGSGIADIGRYQENKVRVGLGTDGCSSSNDLDMWSVMRLAAHLLSNRGGPESLRAHEIFRMATIEGARALQLDSTIGSIEIGKQADLIAIDLKKPHLIPLHDIFAQLVFAVGRGDVSDVWVDGNQVIAQGESTRVDFQGLASEVEVVMLQLQAHFHE